MLLLELALAPPSPTPALPARLLPLLSQHVALQAASLPSPPRSPPPAPPPTLVASPPPAAVAGSDASHAEDASHTSSLTAATLLPPSEPQGVVEGRSSPPPTIPLPSDDDAMDDAMSAITMVPLPPSPSPSSSSSDDESALLAAALALSLEPATAPPPTLADDPLFTSLAHLPPATFDPRDPGYPHAKPAALLGALAELMRRSAPSCGRPGSGAALLGAAGLLLSRLSGSASEPAGEADPASPPSPEGGGKAEGAAEALESKGLHRRARAAREREEEGRGRGGRALRDATAGNLEVLLGLIGRFLPLEGGRAGTPPPPPPPPPPAAEEPAPSSPGPVPPSPPP
ncbi:hypothetical protein TeGR_g5887, partial [Tetraparma gracilis]